MSAKNLKVQKNTAVAADESVSFLRKLLPHVTGWMCLLVTVSFLTLTYDTAYVKLTLCQIGVTVLMSLWAALKISERQNPFTKKNLALLAPFFIYGAWQVLSWSLFPYKWETADEFIRFLLYGATTVLITCEFSVRDVRTVTKYLLAAACVSFGYGLVQTLSIWLPSLDIMEWGGFFGKRIFSTHANPNFFADFIVSISCIIAAVYLRTKRLSLLWLLAVGVICLGFTETKGAWLAFGAASVFLAAGYTYLCVKNTRFSPRKVTICALAILFLAVLFTGIYASKRFQSVSFRMHTWASSFEMVKDSPVLGTGIGSFKVVYPAYRHPQIFYIENAHNTETQHAENEFLEQWVTGGTVGLALFLWIFIFLFRCAYKRIRQSSDADTRIYLLGFSGAVFGMLVHSTVDISLHFASSGLLLAVFIGCILALCRGDQPRQEVPYPPCNKVLLNILKAFYALLLLTAGGWLSIHFYKMMHVLVFHTAGQYLLAALAWTGWLFCVGGVLYIYGRIILKTHRVLVIVILSVSIFPIYFFFNWFAANHYYNVGISLVRLNQLDPALSLFTQAIKTNPFQTEYRQYRANVLSRTLHLVPTLIKERGDTDTPSTDYERAVKDYQIVLQRVPNHSLVYENIGELYYAMAVRFVRRAQQAQNQDEFIQYQQLASENMNQARQALEHSLLLDPVNDNTYLLLSSIALMARDFQTAQYWLNQYRQGPAQVTEKEFLARHQQNPKIENMQQNINRILAEYQNNHAK